MDAASFTDAEVYQLAQMSSFVALPDNVVRRIDEAIRRMSVTRDPSRAEDAFFEVLEGVGFEREVGFREGDERGVFMPIDVACKARKIAVEIDGSPHFMRRRGGKVGAELGGSKFKTRLLEKLGWKVVRLRVTETGEFMTPGGVLREGQEDAMIAYLRKKMAEVNVEL